MGMNRMLREEPLPLAAVIAKLALLGWPALYLRSEWEKAVVPRFEPQMGMFVSGGIGTGKTSLMALIARDMMQKYNCIPRFISTGFLFDLFFDRKSTEIQTLMESTLLFLDDLGREYPADFPLMKFENFVEYRYSNLLPTFITSNLKIDDLRARPGFERIADRLNDPQFLTHLTIPGCSKRVRLNIKTEPK